jgi:hypothetical protein
MQAAQGSSPGFDQVVLHEIRADAELGEGFLVPGFEKKTSRIAENTRPKQECPVDFCGIASPWKM